MICPKLEPTRDDPVTLADGSAARVLDTYGAAGANMWMCYVFAPRVGSRFALLTTRAGDFLWSEVCER